MCTQFVFGCTVCYDKPMYIIIRAISYSCECNHIVVLTCGANDAYGARFYEIREQLGQVTRALYRVLERVIAQSADSAIL